MTNCGVEPLAQGILTRANILYHEQIYLQSLLLAMVVDRHPPPPGSSDLREGPINISYFGWIAILEITVEQYRGSWARIKRQNRHIFWDSLSAMAFRQRINLFPSLLICFWCDLVSWATKKVTECPHLPLRFYVHLLYIFISQVFLHLYFENTSRFLILLTNQTNHLHHFCQHLPSHCRFDIFITTWPHIC